MLTENNQDSSAKKPRWGKIVHVKSSLEPKPDQFAFFIGRWQPLHQGHKALFDRALQSGKNVCIAIRDIKPVLYFLHERVWYKFVKFKK
jgi:FAD synthase